MPKIQPNIALEFDKFSGDYTRDMINCVPHYEQLMYSIVRELPSDFQVNNVLDMGCGNGNVTALLMKQFPHASYHLIDASFEMICKCKKRFKAAKVEYWEGYFNDFEYNLAPYDLVTASFSFHHIDSTEKRAVFNRIFEVLRPGGILAMSDLMIHKTSPEHSDLIKEWSDFILVNHNDREKLEWIMEHYEAFDKPDHYEDQLNWLQEAGFSEVQISWQKGFWVSMQAVK